MRVKTGVVRRRRHKKILKLARGFYSGRRKHFRKAKEQLERSMYYAFRDRKRKKRDFRRLWITRINAACRSNGVSYSKFMHALKLANIELDRKVLADMAMNDTPSFQAILKSTKLIQLSHHAALHPAGLAHPLSTPTNSAQSQNSQKLRIQPPQNSTQIHKHKSRPIERSKIFRF